MAERTLNVTLGIKVVDLPDDFRAKCAGEADMATSDLPTLADESPMALATILSDMVGSRDAQDLLWAGSDKFVNFTAAEVVAASWSD